MNQTLLLKGNPLDKRFQDLLIPKNQNIPDLIECLQKCFNATNQSSNVNNKSINIDTFMVIITSLIKRYDKDKNIIKELLTIN